MNSMKIKLSKDLFYGIIIGILLFASTGSIKKDKAEFKEEKIYSTRFSVAGQVNPHITRLKEDGWTIIDWEIGLSGIHHFHLGK